MKPLELIFALLAKFIDFPSGRLSQLKDEAANWERKQKESEKDSAIKKLLQKSELWYVQVALAIAFLIGVKSIGNWLMSNDQPDVIEDEEIDNDIPSSPRKFSLN